jgi:hypothetical protein
VHLPGDPDQLYAMAGRIATHAGDIRDRAHTLTTHAAEVQWKSSGADAFRSRVAGDAGELLGAAARLDAAAVALRHHADAVRARLHFLHEVAQRAVQIGEGAVKDAEGVVHWLSDGPWW